MSLPGTLLLLGGTALRIFSNMKGAKEAIKQSKYQRDIIGYESKYLEAAQKIEEEKLRRNVRNVISAQRAATAAAGFQGGVGTPLELEIATEIQGDIDMALLRAAGNIEQLRLNTEGRVARAEGHGIASGLYGRASAIGIDTLLSSAARHGWFKPKGKTIPKRSRVEGLSVDPGRQKVMLSQRQQRFGV